MALSVESRQANFLYSATRAEIAKVQSERAPGWEERSAYLEDLCAQIASAIKAA